jgi:hypothetical protein
MGYPFFVSFFSIFLFVNFIEQEKDEYTYVLSRFYACRVLGSAARGSCCPQSLSPLFLFISF